MRKYPKYEPKLIENKIARHVLIGLAIGVAVPIFLTSPYGLYFLVRGGMHYAFKKSSFNRELRRLEKRGYVSLVKKENGWIVKLKKKGLHWWRKVKIDDLRLPKMNKWDGKWRLFIFDIPEKQKSMRDLLSRKLKDLGMFHIQRSVFAYPFDCREELEFITEHYKV